MTGSPPVYDAKYFAYQHRNNEFGGWANTTVYQPFIRPEDNVLDFGAAAGYLLKNLRCHRRMGIDPNPAARAKAHANGITVHANVEAVPDQWADVIISQHALEHCLHPLAELQKLHAKLKPGGKIVFVVPCETIGMRYQPGTIDQHLYSWSPLALGNLFSVAGFRVLESRPEVSKWPPGSLRYGRRIGHVAFDFLSRVYGHLERSWFSVRVVATKSEQSAGHEK